MVPETKMVDQDSQEQVRIQEQSTLYVEDHSRSARDVLKDQQARSTEDEAPILFVP